MTEAKAKDVEETEVPPGYPVNWKPEEIRDIEPLPLPDDQQAEVPLHPQQATQLEEIKSLWPLDNVTIEYDDEGWPTFVSPDGTREEALEPVEDEEEAQEIADKRRLKRSQDAEKKAEAAAKEAEKEAAAEERAAVAEAEKAEKAAAKK